MVVHVSLRRVYFHFLIALLRVGRMCGTGAGCRDMVLWCCRRLLCLFVTSSSLLLPLIPAVHPTFSRQRLSASVRRRDELF